MQTNILDWLEATSARCPDAPAVGDDQTDCTWGQLADTARRAGSFLASRTMPRRPVAFYLEKSVSAFAAMLGTVYAGCCYSVLDTSQPKIPDYLLHHDGVIHCRHFTKTDWGNAKNYDLCIKSDV